MLLFNGYSDVIENKNQILSFHEFFHNHLRNRQGACQPWCKDLLTVIPIWRYVTLLILYNPFVCLSCTEFDLTPPPNSLTIARFSTLLSPFNT